MDDFLDKGMDALSALFENDFERETIRFKTTMQRCYTILKDITFININSRQKRINKNLFDAFSYTISRLSDIEYQSLLRQSERLRKEYMQLFEVEEFLAETELRKTSKRAVRKRFDTMNKFIRQFT